MKRLISIVAIYITILLLAGCKTVDETLYLRQAEVTGPIVAPPIHLTDSTDTPSFTISPRFTFNTKKSFTGDVAQRTSYYTSDTAFIPLENSLRFIILTEQNSSERWQSG